MHNLGNLFVFFMTFAGLGAIFLLSKKGLLNLNLPPRTQTQTLTLGCLVLTAALFEVMCFKVSINTHFWDFLQAYYPAGQAMLHNDVGRLRSLIGDNGQGTLTDPTHTPLPNLFVNIPIFAYLLLPLAALPPHVAALVFTLIGLCLCLAAWAMLVQLAGLEAREKWLLGWLFLANGPLITGIIIGNLSYFILAALAGGLLALHKGRPALAGTILGFATVIKPPLALFGVFFLFRRDWRGLAAYAAIGLLTLFLSYLCFGWYDNLNWFQAIIVQYSHKWLPAFNVQSPSAFILRLSDTVNLTQWQGVLPSSGQKLANQIVTGAIFLIGLGSCYLASRISTSEEAPSWSKRRDLQYLLVICLCLVSSPLTWSHYYVWLLMPAAFFLKVQRDLPRLARLAGWVAIALVTPMQGGLSSFSSPVLRTLYRSFVLSHLLFGGLLWFGVVAWWLAHSRHATEPQSALIPETR